MGLKCYLSAASKTDISYVRVIMARIAKSLHDLNDERLEARAYAVSALLEVSAMEQRSTVELVVATSVCS